jgi:Domain of unknown function (DUF4388)
MAITSSLNDLSLAELFQLVEYRRKSGCLRISTLPNSLAPEAKTYHYYIWFQQGRFVAAVNRLDGQGLVSEITKRGWLSQRVVERLSSRCPAKMPLGVYFKIQGVLQPEQLHLLFSTQLRQAVSLFEVQAGEFNLDTNVPLPWNEVTGLSLRSLDVALGALRILNNWQALAEALPDPSLAIQSRGVIQQKCRLNTLDWQVWEFAQGTVALKNIAKQLNQSVEKIQQAAFRLALAGLVEEVPVTRPIPDPKTRSTSPIAEHSTLETLAESNEVEKPKVSASFLQNLVSFLRSQA